MAENLADLMHAYFVHGPNKVEEAIHRIYNNHGDRVSIRDKAKQLIKFGRSAQVGTSATTLMTLPTGTLNETYTRRNLIDTITSTSASDTGIRTIEGHTVGDDISVSSITQSSGTATATTATAHGFIADEWVYIEGANEAGYNGIVQVSTVPTVTTFTYSVDSGTSSPATGTITATSQNKTFVIQNATLNGQNKVTLTTPLARATRLYVPNQNRAANNVGINYVFRDTTVVSGVPQTAANVHLMMGAAKNQSEKASTSISSVDYWIVTHFRGSVLEKASAFADVSLEVREEGGVFREREDVSCSTSHNGVLNFDPYMIVPKNADVRLVAIADGANTDVSGSIHGFLAIVD